MLSHCVRIKSKAIFFLFSSLFAFLCFESLGQAAGENAPVSLEQGITAYDQGAYGEAEAIFKQLATAHQENGHLFFNLGNTYFRQGEKGKAMASYLAARRLLPRDPDVKANLAFVEEELEDHLAAAKSANTIGFLLAWAAALRPSEIFWLGAALWFLGFLILALALWWRPHKLAREFAVGVIGAAALCFTATAWSLQNDEKWGAVTAAKAEVKSGPGDHNTVVFELHEGAPFIAEQQENGWYQISLSDGKKGWIAGDQALVWGQVPAGSERRTF